MSYTFADVITCLEDLAPRAFAEDWDPVGPQLQLEDLSATVSGLVLSLDSDRQALDLARETGANFLISHHPLFFHPLPRLLASEPEQAFILDCVRQGLSIYAAHTNLDAAVGGVNEGLLDLLGWRAKSSLFPQEQAALQRWRPEDQREDLEPGYVRLVEVETELEIQELSALLKKSLDLPTGFLHMASQPARKIRRVAVSGGAFDGDWIPALSAANCQALICGELRYHEMQALALRGISCYALGHAQSERPLVRRLASYFAQRLPGLAVHCSQVAGPIQG